VAADEARPAAGRYLPMQKGKRSSQQVVAVTSPVISLMTVPASPVPRRTAPAALAASRARHRRTPTGPPGFLRPASACSGARGRGRRSRRWSTPSSPPPPSDPSEPVHPAPSSRKPDAGRPRPGASPLEVDLVSTVSSGRPAGVPAYLRQHLASAPGPLRRPGAAPRRPAPLPPACARCRSARPGSSVGSGRRCPITF